MGVIKKSPFAFAAGAIVLLVLLALPLVSQNHYVLHIAVQIFLLAYLGQSWNIMCGYTGQLSFGHAAFFGLGAYTSTLLLLNLGVSPWIGMLVGGVLAALLGAAIGAVSFKYGARGVYFAFITMAVAEVMRLLAFYWERLTQGAEGLLIPMADQNLAMMSITRENRFIYYYIMLAMLLGCTLLASKIKKMRLGYYLFALRENEDAAEMIGVNVFRYKLIAVAISAFLTALAGTFYAHYYQHFEPPDVFGIPVSFNMIFPVIIGGGNYTLGPIVGSIILTFFEETSRAIMPQNMHGFHRILYGVIIILVIIYMPNGLMELFYRWKARLQRKAQAKAKARIP